MIFLKQTLNINDSKKLTENKEYNTIYKIVNILSWHQKDTPYYELSPYYLRTENNVIFENYWQASKVFEYVHDIEVYAHQSFQGNKNYLWWKYVCDNGTGKEMHFDKNTNTITPEYYKWRQSLFDCNKAIRYPNSFSRRKLVLFALDDNTNRLDYIESRKKIYCYNYIKLIRSLDIYKQLLNDVRNGTSILLTEVDVPNKSKKGYYGKNLDDNNIYTANLERINELLNDPSEPFGHGLCLALALLEDINKT